MIAIVGAGITGLAIAHELSRSGEPHIVLEADDRPGGAIRSGHVDGSLLEWGPQRIRLAPTLHDLIRELGIEGDLVMAPPELPLYVFARGKLRRVPFSFRELARTDLVTTRGKIRMMVEPLTRGAKPGEHVGPFLRRKAGVEAYRNLLGPLYGGLYGSDPDDMLVDLSLGPMLRQSEVGRSLLIALARRGGRITPPPAASFVNGLQTFTDALYRANREAIRLSTRVDVIRPVSDGYSLRIGGDEIIASRVVLTVPAAQAASMIGPVSPPAARAIGSLRYNPLAIVHLRADTDLRGLGYQMGLGERQATRGVTFNDSLFGRTGVYTSFLGGSRSPEIVDLGDRALGELAAAEFKAVTGYGAAPMAVFRTAMPAWDDSWRNTRNLQLPDGLFLAANWESRPGIIGRLDQARRLAALLAG